MGSFGYWQLQRCYRCSGILARVSNKTIAAFVPSTDFDPKAVTLALKGPFTSPPWSFMSAKNVCGQVEMLVVENCCVAVEKIGQVVGGNRFPDK